MKFELRKIALALSVACVFGIGGAVSAHADSIVQDDSLEISANWASPVSICVLGNDTGSGLTITGHSDPTSGAALTLGDDGCFTYTVNARFSGPDSFTYTVKDSDSATATATVNIQVTPFAVGYGMAVAKGSSAPLNILASTYGGDLTVAVLTQPLHGQAQIVDNDVVYTPAAGFAGSDELTYRVQGPTADYTSDATVSITVIGAFDDSYTVSAGTNNDVYFDVLSNDSPSDDLTINDGGFTQPAHGTLALDGDRFAYMPASGYSGPDSFTYTVTGPWDVADTATVNIAVTPFGMFDTVYVVKDASTPLDVLANDRGVDLGIASIVAQPQHGTAQIVDGKIVYTPTAGFTGTDEIDYLVQGPTQDYVNDGPTYVLITVVGDLIAQDDVSVVASSGAEIYVTNNDLGIPPFTVTTVSTPVHGTAVVSGPDQDRVLYTPEAGYKGVDTFTYTVVDSRGQSATGTVTAVVDSITQPDTYTVAKNTETTLDVLSNDLIPGLQVTEVSDSAHGTVKVVNDKVVYTPASGYTGDDTFTYSVYFKDLVFSDTVTLTVAAPPFPTGGSVLQGSSSSALPIAMLGMVLVAAGFTALALQIKSR